MLGLTSRWIANRPVHRPRLWWVAVSICGATSLLLVPIIVLGLLNRNAPESWSVTDPLTPIIAVVYGVVGALLATRRPANILGWVYLTLGLDLAGLSHRCILGCLWTRHSARSAWRGNTHSGSILRSEPQPLRQHRRFRSCPFQTADSRPGQSALLHSSLESPSSCWSEG